MRNALGTSCNPIFIKLPAGSKLTIDVILRRLGVYNRAVARTGRLPVEFSMAVGVMVRSTASALFDHLAAPAEATLARPSDK